MGAVNWTIEGAIERLKQEEANGREAFETRAEICAFMEIQANTLYTLFSDYWGRYSETTVSEEDLFNETLWVYGMAEPVKLQVSLPKTKQEKGEPWRWIWFCFVKVCAAFLDKTFSIAMLAKMTIPRDALAEAEQKKALAFLKRYTSSFNSLRHFFEDSCESRASAGRVFERVIKGVIKSYGDTSVRGITFPHKEKKGGHNVKG